MSGAVLNSTNYELACHMDLSCTWATRKASIHPVSCCLRRCLNSFCVLMHTQDILCPDLPIYSVVSNKRKYYSHGLSIADGVYGHWHCRFASLQEASWALCLYNILLFCAIHKQRCLRTDLACKRSIAISLADCVLSCICKFMFPGCKSRITQ